MRESGRSMDETKRCCELAKVPEMQTTMFLQVTFISTVFEGNYPTLAKPGWGTRRERWRSSLKTVRRKIYPTLCEWQDVSGRTGCCGRRNDANSSSRGPDSLGGWRRRRPMYNLFPRAGRGRDSK